MTRIVAHRALCDGAVENTIAGIKACATAGIRAVEIDVRSRDGVPVLAHDADGADAAEELEAARTALSAFEFALIDVKERGAGVPAARVLLESGDGDHLYFASTSPQEIRDLRRKVNVRTSLSFPGDRPSLTKDRRFAFVIDTYLAVARAVLPVLLAYWKLRYRPDAFTMYRKITTGAAVAAAGWLKTPYYVWTVDEAADVRRFAALGVTGVITNRPTLATATLTDASR